MVSKLCCQRILLKSKETKGMLVDVQKLPGPFRIPFGLSFCCWIKGKTPSHSSQTVGIAEHIDIQDQSLLEVQSPSVNTHHLELEIKCIRGTIAHIWDDYSEVVVHEFYSAYTKA